MTPVTVLTGFLGSGKTTLLNRLLRAPELAGALAVINEFGEIGLDHHLVERIDGTFVLLDNGCLCCTLQSDLAETLADMAAKRRQGLVPAFDRVLVETTGMADPVPILLTLMSDARLMAWYRLDRVVTTVDAALGAETLARYQEAVRQVALADMLLVTKADIAADRVPGLEAALRAVNAEAPLRDARAFTAADLRADIWRRDGAFATAQAPLPHHTAGVVARSVAFDRPVSWPNFAAWARRLIDDRQGDLLRLKAILNVEGRERPVVAQGVQHHFYPPRDLPGWPDGERRSRLVVIGRNLSREELEARLESLWA